MSTQTYKFYVRGMHCNACVLLIESEFGDVKNVQKVKSSLNDHSVEVTGDFGSMSAREVAASLTIPVRDRGYVISVERALSEKKWHEFKIAAPIVIVFAVIFVLLQKVGLVNLVSSGQGVGIGTAFMIGIIASLSSCMAVVGGLILSMSATFAKGGDRVKPQLMFHAGRIVSFVIFGGVIGTIGSAFTLGVTGTFILGVLIGLVMLILGINLLDVFPLAKKLMPAMPSFIAKRAHGTSKINHFLTPILVGAATFFLPCGFTQSMQLYALSTGNFASGALTMLAFAAGTLPVLLLLSFSSFTVKDSPKSGVFFKSAGLIVILFALFNILTSLAAIGAIPPIFNI